MQNLEKNQLDNNYKSLDIDYNNISTSWVNKLNKDKLIIELSRRQLITSGLVTDLKSRLHKYLKGESTHEDFKKPTENITFISEPISNSIDNTIKNNMTDNKKPYFKPTNFSGSISENIDSFLKKYNRAAIINGWSESEKAQYIPVFLEGSALMFYDNIVDSGEDIKWADLEKKLRIEFEPIAQNDMLRLMLEKRKQLPDEPTVSYINEAESLCRRIDNNMSQEEIVRNIMKGLKPAITRYIGIMNNENLSELKNNVRKYEMIEFMTEGETLRSPFDYESEIIKSKIQQISTNKNAKENEIDKLRDEIKDLKTMFSQLLNNNKNEPHQDNIEQKNPYELNKKFNQNDVNNQQWNTQMPQTYNTNLPYNNTPYWNVGPTHYNQPYFQQIPINNNMQQTNQSAFKNEVPNNTQRKKCSICSKTNHSEEKCFFKNKSTICQICNKNGHMAKNCNLFTNNPKN